MVNATVLDELIQETRSVLLEENIMEESQFEKMKNCFHYRYFLYIPVKCLAGCNPGKRNKPVRIAPVMSLASSVIFKLGQKYSLHFTPGKMADLGEIF